MNAAIFNRAAAAAGILALALAVLVGGASPSTADPPTVRQCVDAFGDSHVADYCADPTITVDGDDCDVTASCSVSVKLNFGDNHSESQTYTPSVDEETSVSNVEDIDICFYRNRNGKWAAEADVGCHSSETTVSQAVANGLSADPVAEAAE